MRASSLSTYLTRLIWWSILPLLLAATWLIFAHTWDRLEFLQQEAQRLTHHFAEAMDEYLTARIGALNVLAASPLVDQPDQWPTVFNEALGFSRLLKNRKLRDKGSLFLPCNSSLTEVLLAVCSS